MPTSARSSHGKLVDVTRMEDAALTASRSAEALFGYLSRLDDLRAADLDRDALAERAAEAELHTRVVLSAGMDALNELHDLGLLEHALHTTAKDPHTLNQVTLTEAVGAIAEAFRKRMPTQNWDWLTTASRLVDDVEVKVETDDAGLRGTITHGGQSTVVRLDPGLPATRVGTTAFLSPGAELVHVPTSAIFGSTDDTPAPMAAYEAAVGGMAFTREWVYRHARNAAELGPPERTGGGPVLVVIVIIVGVIATLAYVAAAILGFICSLTDDDWSCRWSSHLTTLGSILSAVPLIVAGVILLSGSGKGSQQPGSSPGQNPSMSYGTNPQ